MGSPFGNIEVRGARENNLKNISLDIPRRQITVFTVVAGLGKSSLIHQTFLRQHPLHKEAFATSLCRLTWRRLEKGPEVAGVRARRGRQSSADQRS
jgi:excinuclease UvrABC ATPase subunit